ncbi:sensor histidine kinase [Pedobacter jeongneungensis]
MATTIFRSAIAKHSIFWILYWLYEIAIVLVLDATKLLWQETILMAILNTSVFYSSAYWVMPQRGKQISYFKSVYKILLVLCSYLAFKTAITVSLLHINIIEHTNLYQNSFAYVISAIWRSSYFIFLGIAFWFSRMSILSEQELRKKELEEQKLKMSILDMKIAYFKSRINPHVLFNALNFLYSESLDLSKELSKGILTLSEILRYSLRDIEDDGKSLLVEEIAQIKNLILLNQFRFGKEIHFIHHEKGVTKTHKIVPLILITLVENALKFGEMTDEHNPIKLNIEVNNGKLRVSLENKKKTETLLSVEGYGIGLKFITYQLDRYYQKDYILKIDDKEEFYTVTLEINI